MFALLLLAAAPAAPPPPSLEPVHLRCEYLTNPLAVDEAAPRLSWELRAAQRSVRSAIQSAYHIVVASRPDLLRPGRADLWDSGKVVSSDTAHVEYSGKPLGPAQRAWWKVRVWDGVGGPSGWSKPSEWTAGLGDGAGWRSRWVGDPQIYPPAAPARNGYHTALSERSDSIKWVQVDLGETRTVDAVRLWPARPYDWQADTPGFLFPLRYRIEGADTQTGEFRTLADRTKTDEPSPGLEAVTLRFEPSRVRRVRLTVVALRERDPGQYGMALAEMEVLDGRRIVSRGAAATALDSIETGPWGVVNLTDGDTVSHQAAGAEPLPPIMLRKEFEVKTAPERAVLFASALGVYEVRINGKRVGDHVLAPEWTDYGMRVQYQGYDVGPLLRPGRNVVAAIVGDGWYAGRIGLFPGRGHYGRRPEFRMEIRDGSGVPVVVSDGTWKMTTDGPIRSSDILDGEVYDARKEMPGWDAAPFDDSSWGAVATNEHPDVKMAAQPNEPIRVLRELKPVAMTEATPGTFIYDLGQNMVGWVRFRLRAPAGTTVHLRHAEMLNDDGTLYTANLRGAPQGDWFTCRGGAAETFEPHFTYHGFRYVEVSGLPARPAPTDLVGRVFNSSSPEIGAFACSDPSLNRLWQNILWTQRANLMSTPTDCPQRDERLGWMGDIQAFGPTACFNMDMAAFFTKWLQDVRDAQADDGRFPDFAPNPGDSNKRFSGVPAWGDAGVIVPWLVYTNYGDRRLLQRHYPAARRWIEYILSQNPDLIWRKGRHADYNDWLNGDTLIAEGWPTKGGEAPRDVFATAFWANSTQLVANMARVLGNVEDAARYADLRTRIGQAFQSAFVSADGAIEGNTQAGYALALHFDLLPPDMRPKAVEHMLAGMEAYGGHISTGIQSTHRMMLELARAGRTDVAYSLLLNRTFPSWLYSVDNGATTIWERWDGYVKGRGFQNPGMNSFNHWALGAVGEWMARVILGLEPDEAAPAWRRFYVRPQPGGGLTWATGSYRSIRGTIEVSWKLTGSAFRLDVTVPPNCSAIVRVPTSAPSGVTESGRPATSAAGVRPLAGEPHAALFEVASGRYGFESRWP